MQTRQQKTSFSSNSPEKQRQKGIANERMRSSQEVEQKKKKTKYEMEAMERQEKKEKKEKHKRRKVCLKSVCCPRLWENLQADEH